MVTLDYVQMFERHIVVEVTDEQYAALMGNDMEARHAAQTVVTDAALSRQDNTPLEWQMTLVTHGETGEEVFDI